ncbi:efflux RND transporter periplasmic adaptor subunit [Thioclava pacifica]|uniref:Uncharacterized protein n=1 Tax=Thioclava pacifica DSM 10166 TaxID=1353537 RepID=A0A074JKE5_9RHOB|nr:efflux RND transporter periplasmic adaptor subunit [Thioclava pacifica]KEO56053.1 hypothetical protein TP2_00605 [Thioclava pacifica DSM 10166]
MTLKPIVFLLALGPGAALAQEAERFDCLIDPSQVLEIGSATDGVIEQVFVSRGDSVKAGDMIAKLESKAEEAQLTYARERAQDMGPIEIARSKVTLLQKAADRATEMGKRNVMADAQVQEAQTSAEVAQLELRAAELDQNLAKLDLERVEAQLERREIRSPIDGIVITRMMGPGEYVYSQTPVAQLAQIDPLHVEVFLPTSMYDQVKAGQVARVYPAAPVGGEYDAKVIVVDKVFDAASDTFGVRLALANPEGKLPAGIDCTVSFPQP